MADISWIKLSTGLPDNKKIKRIRKLPDGDKVILFWVFLLARAGESNKSGGLFFTESMPYSEEDLSADFDFSIEFVKFAILTLERYSMISRYDDILFIKNWEEYQAVEGMEKIREQNRIRKQRQRAKEQTILLSKDMSRDSHGDVTQSHATDIDKELEVDKEIDKEIKKKKSTPVRHKYGEYKNVLLSDEQLEKLKNEFPSDWDQRIEKISTYCESTGKTYKNYLATIRNWSKKDHSRKSNLNGYNKNTRVEKLPDHISVAPEVKEPEIDWVAEAERTLAERGELNE